MTFNINIYKLNIISSHLNISSVSLKVDIFKLAKKCPLNLFIKNHLVFGASL